MAVIANGFPQAVRCFAAAGLIAPAFNFLKSSNIRGNFIDDPVNPVGVTLAVDTDKAVNVPR